MRGRARRSAARRRSSVRLLITGALVAGIAASGIAGEAPPFRPGGLTALSPRDVAGSNLLANAGFEERTGPAPTGWTLRGEGQAWTVDGAGRGGRASLKLDGTASGRMVPSAEQTVTLEAGLYTLEAWVKLRGMGGDERGGVRLCLDGRPRLSWWKCTDVMTGTRDWTLARQALLHVTDPGAYRVTAGAYGLPEGTAWFDDVSLARVGRLPLDVYLLHPNFRGLLFDDRPHPVRVALSAAAPGGSSAGLTVRLDLVDERGGTVRVRRDLPAPAERVTVELDAAGLPVGGYRLRAELVRGSDVVFRHPDYRIVKLPAAVRRRLPVWYDERNVLHLHGRPAFVLGLYTTGGYSGSASSYARGTDGWGTEKIAQAPFNMLINYWLGLAPVGALEALMDDLAGRGIHYLHTVNFYYRDDPQYPKIPHPAAGEGEEALNRWIARALGGHRGLAGFYTADERPAEWVERVFRQHHALAEGAPGSVSFAVLGDGWEGQAPLWRDAVDVLGMDPYPITRPPGENHLAMAGEWTRLGVEAVQGSRPVWTVLQYFPLTAAGGWPREQDLRAMSWMAIVEGARGLFYWSFGAKGLAWVKDPALREQRWQELVRITREIKALEPILLAPDAAVVNRESSAGAVRVLGKQGPDGARYLFAYNSRNAITPVTWTLAQPAREAIDLATSRPVSLAGGTALSLRLEPYEVRQIRLR